MTALQESGHGLLPSRQGDPSEAEELKFDTAADLSATWCHRGADQTGPGTLAARADS
jgi:hypothetical protein